MMICLHALIIIFYFLFPQAVVLDQDLEGDMVADIQKNLEDLINAGLRQRLINLIKVKSCVFHSSLQCNSFLFCRV